MNLEDLSNKKNIPSERNEISSKNKEDIEGFERIDLFIYPKELPQASIQLTKYNIENKTTPTITKNYNDNKNILNEAIEQCKNDPQNVYNLAYLKRLIDLYEPTLDPINSFLIKLLSIGPFGKANETYKKIYHELSDNQQKQTQILVKSFEETQWINALQLPAGKYSGPVKDGLPHTEPHNDEASRDFSTGTLLSPNSYNYSGEFKKGKIDGRGVAVNPQSLDKAGLPIKYEGLFENGIYRGKIISCFGRVYAGPTISNNGTEIPHGNGVLYRNGERWEGSFEDGCLKNGLKVYADGTREEGIFTNTKGGRDPESSFLTTGERILENGIIEQGTFFLNALDVGTRQEGNVLYSINKKHGGIWKITDPQGTRMGRFNLEKQLDGSSCVKEYIFNVIAYKDVGTFINGIFKDGIRNYTNREGINVTETGEFEYDGFSEQSKLKYGKVSKTDNKGFTTDYETIRDQKDSYTWKTKNLIIHGKFIENLTLEGEGKITRSDGTSEEGNFKDNKLEGAGKIVIKNKKDELITLEGRFEKGELIEKKVGDLNYSIAGGRFDENGLLQGYGQMYLPKAFVITGNFKDSQPHGKMSEQDYFGNLTTKYYIEGKLVNMIALEEYKKNNPDQIEVFS